MLHEWCWQRPIVTQLRRIRGGERVETHRTPDGAWAGETWRVPIACVVPHNLRVVRLPEAQRVQRAARAR